MRKREAYEVEFKVSSMWNLKKKTEGAMSGVGAVLAKSVFGFDTDMGRVAPDAWFLAEDRTKPSIIAICVAPDFDITIKDCYSEKLLRTCLTMFTSPGNYEKVAGVLYNGEIERVFKCENGKIEEIEDDGKLKEREFYLNFWAQPIDKC